MPSKQVVKMFFLYINDLCYQFMTFKKCFSEMLRSLTLMDMNITERGESVVFTDDMILARLVN